MDIKDKICKGETLLNLPPYNITGNSFATVEKTLESTTPPTYIEGIVGTALLIVIGVLTGYFRYEK